MSIFQIQHPVENSNCSLWTSAARSGKSLNLDTGALLSGQIETQRCVDSEEVLHLPLTLYSVSLVKIAQSGASPCKHNAFC